MGDDIISGTGDGGEVADDTGIANSGTINAGMGDNTISGIGTADDLYIGGSGTGIANSGIINAGMEDDIISGTGT
ncbi:MAG: hypothetical protein ACYT04_000000100615, partial [Nostoc sp.]